MPTDKQQRGDRGEKRVKDFCICPKCKKEKTFKQLPANFKCVDIICDFCGYLAQVKTSKVRDIEKVPKTILGAAWGPQKERMDAGIYFPLYIVLESELNSSKFSIFYLPVDYQDKEIFKPRKPLSSKAKRAGWQGFNFDLSSLIGEGVIRKVK